MISNKIIRGYLNCKYKTYQLLNNGIEESNDFEQIESIYLNQIRKEFYTDFECKTEKKTWFSNKSRETVTLPNE